MFLKPNVRTKSEMVYVENLTSEDIVDEHMTLKGMEDVEDMDYEDYGKTSVQLPPAPDGVLENVHCGCKSGCSNNRCSCLKENLHCTALCHCEGCANRSGSADEDSENEAEDYDISHEDDSESDNDYGDN